MKKITLAITLAFSLIICLDLSIASTNQASCSLAAFVKFNAPGVYASGLDVFQNQIEPINDAFGFNADLSNLERSAIQASQPNGRSSGENAILVKMNVALPDTDLEDMDYSILRNGKELNQQSDTIQLGDTIRLKPRAGKASIRGQDWVATGASIGTPPVIWLKNSEEVNKIKSLFDSKYPCHTGHCQYAPLFSAVKKNFKTTPNQYKGELGYQAYIVPGLNGKQMGVQVFCYLEPRHYSLDICQPNEFGGVDCKPRSTGTQNIHHNPISCALFVDKVIEDNKATEADWYMPLKLGTFSFSMYRGRQIQVVPGDKKPPVADFDCKVAYGKLYGQKTEFLECDASKSHDPDGTIQEYQWGPWAKQGTQFKKPIYGNRQYTVTLRVTDNEGFYAVKTKTYNTAHMVGSNQNSQTPAKPAQEPITELTAEYNNQTKMVELWANCTEKTVQIDIDQLDNQVNPTNSILEKQAIPCNKTTPIGPLKVKGNYIATATINGKTKTAVFTIN